MSSGICGRYFDYAAGLQAGKIREQVQPLELLGNGRVRHGRVSEFGGGVVRRVQGELLHGLQLRWILLQLQGRELHQGDAVPDSAEHYCQHRHLCLHQSLTIRHALS